MSLERLLAVSVRDAVLQLYGSSINEESIQIQKTRKDFNGDITVVVFPFQKISKKGPEQTANDIGLYLEGTVNEVEGFSVIKGFLNLNISTSFYIQQLNEAARTGYSKKASVARDIQTYMVEYSSPNTNKPLHLGHVRNNLLGFAVSNLLEANGKKVVKTNIVNDRGIHICKSMLAWKKWGNGETPESSGKKGDHLVGDYYVKFDQEYKKQIAEMHGKGMSREEAEQKAPVIEEARELLRKWEAGDPETVDLWKTMNEWVYDGFNITYERLGVNFDKIYYESDTYIVGRDIVMEGLEKGVFYRHDDSSVWVSLKDEGLDEKILLRSDGTSVYMTQDIGTAQLRQNDYQPDKMIYVVGNEQEHHFRVLSIVLDKLGFSWAKDLYHLSYGMVELPEGKMKSREGTVVDADDLIDEMIETAREMSKELGKLEGMTCEEKENIFRIIGLGALKYFILKVDPSKNMTFDPRESIDFNGNTGPFIQYTYARICSVFRKAGELGIKMPGMVEPTVKMNEKEKTLLKLIYDYPFVVREAGNSYNPALVANYIFELVKEYNQFYHDYTILKEEDKAVRDCRLMLSKQTAEIVRTAMGLLGIEVPERM